ncbi:Immunoglobulin heavy variable 2-5 [Varanus komodoensis]|nr:Immunoglobulin heavy variable 2-5 [Varanus komodoensis]
MDVHSEVNLGQPTFVQLKPTETLRLTCSISGFSLSASGNAVSWIRQTAGKGLEWMCLIYWDDDKRYLDSLKNQVTISRDVSRSEVYLEMRNLEARDTGTYYCAKSHSIQKQGGTQTNTSFSMTRHYASEQSVCRNKGQPNSAKHQHAEGDELGFIETVRQLPGKESHSETDDGQKSDVAQDEIEHEDRP